MLLSWVESRGSLSLSPSLYLPPLPLSPSISLSLPPLPLSLSLSLSLSLYLSLYLSLSLSPSTYLQYLSDYGLHHSLVDQIRTGAPIRCCLLWPLLHLYGRESEGMIVITHHRFHYGHLCFSICVLKIIQTNHSAKSLNILTNKYTHELSFINSESFS